uniref:Transmembrane protein n=1 Tax=Plectus sambesii TaxID=2011161 RepID=A0A914WQ43_9BILA
MRTNSPNTTTKAQSSSHPAVGYLNRSHPNRKVRMKNFAILLIVLVAVAYVSGFGFGGGGGGAAAPAAPSPYGYGRPYIYNYPAYQEWQRYHGRK